MSTKYPNQIDTNTEIPLSTDNVTPVKAIVTNTLRGAIMAVQSELGIQPSGTFATVRARLDALEALIRALNGDVINIVPTLSEVLNQGNTTDGINLMLNNNSNLLLSAGSKIISDSTIIQIDDSLYINGGLQLSEKSSAPQSVVSGRGLLWTRSSDSKLIFTDDSSVDWILNQPAGATSLSSVLSIGNTTGGHNIILSVGDFLQSADGYVTINDGLMLNGNLDMNSNRITEVQTPLLGTDGVNKNYVDFSAPRPVHPHDDGYYLKSINGTPTWSPEVYVDVNILDFGADPTGTFNSSTAIQNAINFLSTTGGDVIIPKGTYLINSQITISNNHIHLRASRGAIFRKNNTNFNMIRLDGDFNEISNLEMDGYSLAQGSCILIRGAENIVNKCYLHNNGLNTDGAYGNGSHGVCLDGQTSTCRRNIINDCTISDCHDIGISQNTASDNRIFNNRIFFSGFEGITCDVTSHRSHILNNRLGGNCVRGGAAGISIDDSELCLINNNIISATASSCPGIKTNNNVGASSYCICNNNIIIDNGGYGIQLFTGGGGSALFWTINGNVIRGNGSGSIRLESGCNNNQVRGNSLNGVAVSDAGSTNTVN